MNVIEEVCAVCGTRCEKFCSGCKKVFYCSVDHQKSHRKFHKKDCFPAILRDSERLGRCFVASRNIRQGELIFKDKALVTGPSGAELYFHHICLGCYREVKSGYRCSLCAWPVCSKQCEMMQHHMDFECKIFSKKKIGPYFSKPVQYELINTLRSLLLVIADPEIWEEFVQLESHAESRAKNPDAVTASEEHVQFIHSVCKLREQFDAAVIDHVVGIWGINSFGANPPAGPHPGRARMATLMFPRLCLAAHNCVPNTRGILLEDVTASKPSYSMELIASLPIREGEQIHTTYANVNEGTFERRLILRDNYFFLCSCKRCSDSTEFGTFFSAFKCTECRQGSLLPRDPLNLESVWGCSESNCKGFRFHYADLKMKLSQIRRELNLISSDSSISAIRQIENIVSKTLNVVHSNHWIMIEMEFLLAMKILGALPKCNKSDEDRLLQRLVEISEHCLSIAELLQPGHNSYRGKLLFCLCQGKINQLLNRTKVGGIETILQNKALLEKVRSDAKEAMEILSREPERSEDHMLSQKLARDLIQIKSMIDLISTQETTIASLLI